MSADTGNSLGFPRTVPVKVTGKSLRLNLDTGALGELQVALKDVHGRDLPGFSRVQCVPVQPNATGVLVSWGESDLTALLGQEVILEFQSNRTKLYSFRFE